MSSKLELLRVSGHPRLKSLRNRHVTLPPCRSTGGLVHVTISDGNTYVESVGGPPLMII
jgi:hypothetical protein